MRSQSNLRFCNVLNNVNKFFLFFFFRGELVRLKDIENIYKKRKHDKQTRIDSIKVLINELVNQIFTKLLISFLL